MRENVCGGRERGGRGREKMCVWERERGEKGGARAKEGGSVGEDVCERERGEKDEASERRGRECERGCVRERGVKKGGVREQRGRER